MAPHMNASQPKTIPNPLYCDRCDGRGYVVYDAEWDPYAVQCDACKDRRPKKTVTAPHMKKLAPKDYKPADERPQKYGWAPGSYLCACNTCGYGFWGAKRAWTCADCAYETSVGPENHRTER